MQNPNVIAFTSFVLVIGAIAFAWQKHYYLAWGIVAVDVAMLVGAMWVGRKDKS